MLNIPVLSETVVAISVEFSADNIISCNINIISRKKMTNVSLMKYILNDK